MKKYTFYVTDFVTSTYEVFADNEDDAEEKLEDILTNQDYINDDIHFLSDSEISLIEVEDGGNE